MYKLCNLLFFVLLLSSCTSSNSRVPDSKDSSGFTIYPPLSALGQPDSSFSHISIDSALIQNNEAGNMIIKYFVVIVDTSKNYFNLNAKMMHLAKKCLLSIDSMGRYFDAKKGIILPADCGDDIYAGQYYPRRFEGSELSIEYYNAYSSITTNVTMAIVAGQYTDIDNANKQLNKVKPFFPNAFIKEALLYNACMH